MNVNASKARETLHNYQFEEYALKDVKSFMYVGLNSEKCKPNATRNQQKGNGCKSGI